MGQGSTPTAVGSNEGLGVMNWAEAVTAMQAGHQVQRASEQHRALIGDSDGVPIYECGQEPCLLAHAWTADEQPALVFRGARSGELFVPDSEHRNACDWVLV